MLNGEILFIIAPSDPSFKDITYQSLVRHLDISILKTYGFYIFDESNKDEWNIYDNKYLNIFNICYKFQDYYEIAIILSGNIFFNMKNFQTFKIFLDKLIAKHFTKNKDLIVGFPYLTKKREYSFIRDFHVDNINNDYNKIIKKFGNQSFNLIDLDFCFLNLKRLNMYLNILEFTNGLKIKEKNPQLILNAILLSYIKTINWSKSYLKQNVYEKELNHLLEKSNPFVYKFTDNYFPLVELTNNKNIPDEIKYINYYIFNRLYEEYKNIDNSQLDDKISFYIEDNYMKTKFVDLLNL